MSDWNQAINVDGVRWGNAAMDAGEERRRAHQVQIAKGRTSLENLPWNDPLWLPVLVEEVGEVARALNDGEPLGRLRGEAVQVAAMALAYADAIQEAMEAEVFASGHEEAEAHYKCAHCGENIYRPTFEAARAAGAWHDKVIHGHCFCGKPLDEHPPGPPCPPPLPPGFAHG